MFQLWRFLAMSHVIWAPLPKTTHVFLWEFLTTKVAAFISSHNFRWDRVEIQDGDIVHNAVQRFCGTQPIRFLSNSDTVHIAFYSDISNNDVGFRLHYREVPSGNNYIKNYLFCIWIPSIPIFQSVVDIIVFIVFYSCIYTSIYAVMN